MADLPEAFVSHVSQGRVRVKIPAKKNDRGYFSELKNHLVPLPGVVKVETNSVTGSVLVLHSLDLKSLDDLKTMSQYPEMMGLFKLAEPQTGNVSFGRDLAGAFAGLNETVKGVTGGVVDLPTCGILGLLGLGIWQISRGEVAVPAVTALWYASSILRDQLANGKQEDSKVTI
ncbi:MAG TPA: hypothetical protein VMT22_19710 [Terriglobales bacterium]|jgi:hypothetical protein|nr:hypothetical protein [Terriglobales bacterium]